MGVTSRAPFFGHRIADNCNHVSGHRTNDPRHVFRLDPVRSPDPEHRVDVGMNDMRRGEGLEGRVFALPSFPESAYHPIVVARQRLLLKMRSEKSEASFEYFGRSRDAGARKARSEDAALCR